MPVVTVRDGVCEHLPPIHLHAPGFERRRPEYSLLELIKVYLPAAVQVIPKENFAEKLIVKHWQIHVAERCQESPDVVALSGLRELRGQNFI